MSYYMDYSTRIYNVYLKYIAPEDIYVYSIDEVFCDVTHYLKTYNMTPRELVTKIIQDVYDTTGITATAGIGTNLYLCKVAMDIGAKHVRPDKNEVIKAGESKEITLIVTKSMTENNTGRINNTAEIVEVLKEELLKAN